MAQQQAAQAADLAKRRSRKPTDKSMPDGVDECIIGDGAQRYRELRDFERRLDATMTRKRLDIMDSMNRTTKVGGDDRVYNKQLLTCVRSALQDPPHMDHKHRRRPAMAGKQLARDRFL
jgi:hypothetical protein